MSRGAKRGPAVLDMYPEALSTSNFVPPFHFYHVPYFRAKVAEQPLLLFQQLSGCAQYACTGESVSLAGGETKGGAEEVEFHPGKMGSCGDGVGGGDIGSCEKGEAVDCSLSEPVVSQESGEAVNLEAGEAVSLDIEEVVSHQKVSHQCGRTVSDKSCEAMSHYSRETVSCQRVNHELVEGVSYRTDDAVSNLTEQAVSQPTSEASNHPNSEVVRRLANEAVSHPPSEAVNHPVIETVNHSASETVSRPRSEAMTNPNSEAVSRPSGGVMMNPNIEAVSRPSGEAMTNPNNEAVSLPRSEAMTNPNSEATSHQSVRHELGDSVSHRIWEAVNNQTGEAVSQPSSKAVKHPIREAVSPLTSETVSHQTDETVHLNLETVSQIGQSNEMLRHQTGEPVSLHKRTVTPTRKTVSHTVIRHTCKELSHRDGDQVSHSDGTLSHAECVRDAERSNFPVNFVDNSDVLTHPASQDRYTCGTSERSLNTPGTFTSTASRKELYCAISKSCGKSGTSGRVSCCPTKDTIDPKTNTVSTSASVSEHNISLGEISASVCGTCTSELPPGVTGMKTSPSLTCDSILMSVSSGGTDVNASSSRLLNTVLTPARGPNPRAVSLDSSRIFSTPVSSSDKDNIPSSATVSTNCTLPLSANADVEVPMLLLHKDIPVSTPASYTGLQESSSVQNSIIPTVLPFCDTSAKSSSLTQKLPLRNTDQNCSSSLTNASIPTTFLLNTTDITFSSPLHHTAAQTVLTVTRSAGLFNDNSIPVCSASIPIISTSDNNIDTCVKWSNGLPRSSEQTVVHSDLTSGVNIVFSSTPRGTNNSQVSASITSDDKDRADVISVSDGNSRVGIISVSDDSNRVGVISVSDDNNRVGATFVSDDNRVGATFVSDGNNRVGATSVYHDDSRVDATFVSDDNNTVGATSVSDENNRVGATFVSDDNTVGATSVSYDNNSVGATSVSDDNNTVGATFVSDENNRVGATSVSYENNIFGATSVSDGISTIGTITAPGEKSITGTISKTSIGGSTMVPDVNSIIGTATIPGGDSTDDTTIVFCKNTVVSSTNNVDSASPTHNIQSGISTPYVISHSQSRTSGTTHNHDDNGMSAGCSKQTCVPTPSLLSGPDSSASQAPDPQPVKSLPASRRRKRNRKCSAQPPHHSRSVSIQPLNADPSPTSMSSYSLWTQPSAQQDNWNPRVVQSNNIQDDFAQNHLLINLQALAKHQGAVMFVLSQFIFDDYFKNFSKKDKNKIRKPADLAESHQRGDFDLLIIHRHFGILLGEIKSVGWNPDIQRSRADADCDVAVRMDRAVKQLIKSQTVITYLLNDIAPGLTVRKTLFLPYVSTEELRRVLSARTKLREELSQTLEATSTEDAWLLCCCSEHLSDAGKFWEVNSASLIKLVEWWKRVWRECRVDPLLSDELYLDIVGRFVGTASAVNIHCVVPPRVEVRTHGEAVSELGQRLARLVLTQHQLDLVNSDTPRVCVTGPPGTGKTVVLILKGLTWALRGHPVHVLSTRPASLAASHVMFHQLRRSLVHYQNVQVHSLEEEGVQEGVVKLVMFHEFNFYLASEVDRALELLEGAALDGRVFVLMEEAVFSDSGSVLGPHYLRFINELWTRVSDLHLWVARVRHDKIPPALHTVTLTTPLRSAPVVQREVQTGVTKYNIHRYNSLVGMTACPGDGPSVMRLRHGGQGHTGSWPHECPQCGLDVARLLRQLNVGATAKAKLTKYSPNPLRYSDVFVMTRTSDLRDDIKDDAGNVSSSASGVVTGLRQAGIPVCVLRDIPGSDADEASVWTARVKDTAVAGKEHVTVAHWRPVLGLERKLVVWLRGRAEGEDRNRSDEEVEAWDRVWIVSRCTTQLILVDVA